jgi:hypothetical protein
VGRLLCPERIDLWFRRPDKRFWLMAAREPVQFGSALFDFGGSGYMGAVGAEGCGIAICSIHRVDVV